jgi:hypothetical protein
MSEKPSKIPELVPEMQSSKSHDGGLVNITCMMEQVFPDPVCRPSTRWGRAQVANRTIPFVRIGRLCFFNVGMVRDHLHAAAMKKVRAAV